MSEGGGPKMLRMVRWQGIIQDAERLRNYTGQDVYEIVSRIVHMGDPRSAKAALLDWAEDELQRLKSNPATTASDLDRLHYTYLEMRSKIDGRAFVMDT